MQRGSPHIEIGNHPLRITTGKLDAANHHGKIGQRAAKAKPKNSDENCQEQSDNESDYKGPQKRAR